MFWYVIGAIIRVHSVAGQRPQNGPLRSEWVKTQSRSCPHIKISVKTLEYPQHKY